MFTKTNDDNKVRRADRKNEKLTCLDTKWQTLSLFLALEFLENRLDFK